MLAVLLGAILGIVHGTLSSGNRTPEPLTFPSDRAILGS
jgi:hypothetical protein